LLFSRHKLIVEKGHLPVKRPIAASHLSIVRIYSAVESDRSVVASSINFIKTLTISGQLPIVASYLHVKETYAVT
jgi:hypothetical protein